MANILTSGAQSIILPDDLRWIDEFDWQAVDQRQAYTIAGALIVESARKLAGRPITLAGGSDFAFMRRSDIELLEMWRALPGLQMGLVLRSGASRSVVFDHARGAVVATPVVAYSDPLGADFVVPTLRFLEV